ncbi:glycophorin-C isoform X6 [Pongo abelii]|uniref:glycophorin-C isoform X6 n=1 Tax=Pongo abelii TaxID=9601 RepID=UPI003005E94C
MNGWEAMEEKSTPRPGSRQQPGRPTNLGPREEHQFPFPDLPLPRLPAEPDPGITSSSTTMDIAITAGPDPGITSSSTTMDIAIIAGNLSLPLLCFEPWASGSPWVMAVTANCV